MMKLDRRLVPKPWGRTRLPPMFGDAAGERIGEVWFTGPDTLPLLAKYIFTSERLSIQNHPGGGHGKEECWFVLDAEPGATIALGWTREVGRDEIRAAAADGSIVDLLDWRPVDAGDFYYVPAGTVHAIGAGLALLEFQQNRDVTYRLYDYGRPRALHLDAALEAAELEPYRDPRARRVPGDEDLVLVDGPYFRLAHSSGEEFFAGRRRWALPIDGRAASDGLVAVAGECLLLEPADGLRIDGRVLIGAESGAHAHG